MALQIGPFFWVVLTVLILNFLARKVNDFILRIATLLSRSYATGAFLTAWILLPGTFVHELAHLIGFIFFVVPYSKFTVQPVLKPDRVVLGSVAPGASVKRNRIPIRDSLIGVAPFFFGIGVVLLISFFIFQIDMADTGNIISTPEAMQIAIQQISQTENPWLWIYLLFSIGNGIFPSDADRKQWPMFGLIFLIVLVALIYFGVQQLFFQALFAILNNISGYLMLAFAITIVIDIVALPILWFIHILLDSMFGYPQ